MSCCSRPETKQEHHKTRRHVDTLQLCLATDVSASLQVCPGETSQWASTCVEPKQSKAHCISMSPMSKMSTYSEAIRIPSSKVSLGNCSQCHMRGTALCGEAFLPWGGSAASTLLHENRHNTTRRPVRTTSSTLKPCWNLSDLSLNKTEAEEQQLKSQVYLISISDTWLWEKASALFQPEGLLDSEQLPLIHWYHWCWNAEFGAPRLQYVQSIWTQSTLGLQPSHIPQPFIWLCRSMLVKSFLPLKRYHLETHLDRISLKSTWTL